MSLILNELSQGQVLIVLRLSATAPLAKSVSLGATDSLKLILTTIDGKTAKRPHQAFLTLTDPVTGLEESFVLSVKESGKAKVDLVRYDIPMLQSITNCCRLTKISLINSSPQRNPS